ncbi:hypothetical protein DSO57_1015124 [Entomophthora muscae]|uniref:Uncharacterized protein n=1 Tax=Entomophthora muscae TaxID=34485 RepID=A0ACC2SU24_9FUNG|nr:hypothetical protein DSO57_1015124 [Entomophthora muscae]
MLLIIALVVVIAVLCYRVASPPAHLHHLPKAPFLASLFTFLTRPVLEAMELVYWPVIFQTDYMLSWFLGSWWVVISEPFVIKEILSDANLGEKNLFTDLSPHALIGEYMGENILYSKGGQWRKLRGIIGPSFHREWPIEIFNSCTAVMMEQIKNNGGKMIDVHTLFTAMTLDALGLAVLGVDFGASRDPLASPYTQSYHRAARGVSKNIYFMFPFLEKLPIPSRTKDREAVREFRRLVSEVLQQKRKEIEDGTDKEDLITRMLLTETVDLSDTQLINNVVVMFAAGHDTTANTLSFTLYHLSKNPEVQEKARDEILSILRDSTTPTAQQLSRLVYLEAIILESMRLSPTLPQLRRELKQPLYLPNGNIMPKGTLVLLQTYSAMNHPKHWDQPHKFNPMRFLSYDTKSSSWAPNFAARSLFFAFGGGVRSCIGQNMAIVEQRAALSAILRNYRIELPSDSPHKVRLITNQDPVCRPVDLKLDFIPTPPVPQ